MPRSFHNHERKLQRGKASLDRPDISPKNRQAILEFADYCVSEGLSIPRAEKYFGRLKRLVLLSDKDFADATKTDIERVVGIIERMDHSEWTKHDFRVTLKRFYRWLRGTDCDPPEVAWVHCRVRNCLQSKTSQD